ncbi:hypothetical protein [Agrobacterium salinitolerans]|uniref:hypothetical protein n=1 Tax=Agrobacterium salinitolerans TaxID=1183413 RepID=UPI0022B8562D|nr:hypothetical protein [Agrobacterium salinitolerans]MCZ7885128.1 hypothetical protein [Agrobacterium salinitolerans]
MTFSAQLMNGFQILFKPLVVFTPHFPAILENSGLRWKTSVPLQFRHLGNPLKPSNRFAPPIPGLSFFVISPVVNGTSPPYPVCDERKAFALPGFSTKTNPLVLNGAVHRRPVSGLENDVA